MHLRSGDKVLGIRVEQYKLAAVKGLSDARSASISFETLCLFCTMALVSANDVKGEDGDTQSSTIAVMEAFFRQG